MQIQNTDLPAPVLSMRSSGGVSVHCDDVLVLFGGQGGGGCRGGGQFCFVFLNRVMDFL